MEQAAAFNILPDILSRPVVLDLDRPFEKLSTLLYGTNLKRNILDWVGFTDCSKETLESAMEFAKKDPILEKYALNASAISSGEVRLAFIFNSITDLLLKERPIVSN